MALLTLTRRCARGGPWFVTSVALAVMVGVGAIPVCAQPQLDEYEVKAAFVYNFMKFVQWPADGRDTFLLCTAGDDRFGDSLEGIVRDKRVQGRSIVVRGVTKKDALDACHVLFIAEAQARDTSDLVHRVERAAVLTVGETPYFLDDGGMIRFFREQKRVRFEINPESAQRAGLKINSQLLSLGRR